VGEKNDREGWDWAETITTLTNVLV
jgi:hypothetical protein